MEKMAIHSLKYLTASEKTALECYIARLQERYTDQVLRVLLFGSKVRGDFDEESDLDLFVVVKSSDWRFHQEVSHLALAPMLEHDTVISTLTVGEDHFNRLRRLRTSFYRNLQREGINLWPAKSETRSNCS